MLDAMAQVSPEMAAALRDARSRKTVYILGAGVNRGVFDFYGVTPPLMHDVFSTANRVLRFDERTPYRPAPLLSEFLQREFHVHPDLVYSTDLNWEACIDRAEERIATATEAAAREKLLTVRFELFRILAFTLGALEREGVSSRLMRNFGNILWAEQATVLTFNYDTIVEQILESASGGGSAHHDEDGHWQRLHDERQAWEEAGREGPRPRPDWAYRSNQWIRELGYGVPFDELRASQPWNDLVDVDGATWYGHPGNGFVMPRVLKMHGSLNWFEYTDRPEAVHPSLPVPDKSLAGRSLLLEGEWAGPLGWPSHRHLLLEPLMVTGRDKEERLRHPPFPRIWELAEEALRSAERVVVVGYSFSDPMTDALVRRSIGSANPPTFEWVLPSMRKRVDTANRLGVNYDNPGKRTIEEYVWSHPVTRANMFAYDRRP